MTEKKEDKKEEKKEEQEIIKKGEAIKKYAVCVCLECSKPVLCKIEFVHANSLCCTKLGNLKVVKVFNDPREAENYFGLSKNEEE